MYFTLSTCICRLFLQYLLTHHMLVWFQSPTPFLQELYSSWSPIFKEEGTIIKSIICLSKNNILIRRHIYSQKTLDRLNCKSEMSFWLKITVKLWLTACYYMLMTRMDNAILTHPSLMEREIWSLNRPLLFLSQNS